MRIPSLAESQIMSMRNKVQRAHRFSLDRVSALSASRDEVCASG